MNDARDGRGPDDDEAGRAPAAEPDADTSGLDAGDWLAAQFDDEAEAEAEADGDGADDAAERPDPATAATPISPETVSSTPFTVPPAPTAESDVVKSSGHPMALDLSALAGAVPPPSPEPTPPVGAAEARETASEAEATVEPGSAPERVAPPRYEVPPAVAPRPVAAPPAVPAVAVPPAVPPVAAADRAANADEPEHEDAPAAERDAVEPRRADEPGPFTALISPPVAPEPVFPSSFDWSTPASSDDRAEDPDRRLHAPDDGDLPPVAVEDAPEAPVTTADAADDAQTRAFELPVTASPAEPEPALADSEPALAEAEPEAEPSPVEPEPERTPAEPEPEPTPVEPEPEPEPTPAEPKPEPEPEQTLAVPQPAPAEPEPASAEPEPAPAEPESASAEPEPAPAEPEPESASAEPESAPAESESEPDPTPAASESGAEGTPAEPWWIAEHHEMTRRERREAEAAGVVVPPAVAAGPDAPAAVVADVDDPDGAGAVAAPPAGLPFGAPAPSSTPSADEPEPTFTELLGIVRPSSDSSETVEDTPGDPAADAGRSDLVDPGPLPSGGSWALSDELTAEAPAAPAASEAVPRDEELVGQVDLDDPFAVLQVEAEEDAPDAATAALPVAGAGLAGPGATEPAASTGTPATAPEERPRAVPHAADELPGLSVGGGSAPAQAAASSSAPPFAARNDASAPSAPAAPSGSGAGWSPAGSGGGIASWSRGRKVLLGVAAALVIVLALVALFLLSRSLFAGTPQPTEAPAAAVATRTVTAAPAEIAQEAVAGPLATGTHPWNDLQGGECFSAFEDAWQQDYEVVDCGQPHVAQLASIGVLDADPAAAYPGSDALQSQMSVLCTGASALDLAAASTYPDAQFSASWPSTDAEWAAGVRSYWCFVDRSSGEAMTTRVAPAAA